MQYRQQDSNEEDVATLSPGMQVHFAWKYPNGTKKLLLFDVPVCISDTDQVTTFRHDGRLFSCEIQPRDSFKAVIISEYPPGQIVDLGESNVLVERRPTLCVRSMTVFARQKIDIEFVCRVRSIRAELELENKNKFAVCVNGAHGTPAIEARAGFSCVSTALSLRIADVSLIHTVPGLEVPPLLCMWFDGNNKSDEASLSGEFEECFLRVDACLLHNTLVHDRILLKSFRFALHPIVLNVHASILDSALTVVEKVPRHDSSDDNKKKEIPKKVIRRLQSDKPVLIEEASASPIQIHFRFMSSSTSVLKHRDVIQWAAQFVSFIPNGSVELLPRTRKNHMEMNDGVWAKLRQWKNDDLKKALSTIEGNKLIWYIARLALKFIPEDDND